MNSKKLDIQKCFQRTIIIAVVAIICSVFYIALTKDTEPYAEVVASGVITEKYQTDYSCGSKNRYTCSAYFFTINNTKIRVAEDVYLKNVIDNSITLTRTVKPETTLLQDVASALAFIIAIILILCAIGIFGKFLQWGMFHSNNTSFIAYLKKEFS